MSSINFKDCLNNQNNGEKKRERRHIKQQSATAIFGKF